MTTHNLEPQEGAHITKNPEWLLQFGVHHVHSLLYVKRQPAFLKLCCEDAHMHPHARPRAAAAWSGVAAAAATLGSGDAADGKGAGTLTLALSRALHKAAAGGRARGVASGAGGVRVGIGAALAALCCGCPARAAAVCCDAACARAAAACILSALREGDTRAQAARRTLSAQQPMMPVGVHGHRAAAATVPLHGPLAACGPSIGSWDAPLAAGCMALCDAGLRALLEEGTPGLEL